jgi:hypothetical protein
MISSIWQNSILSSNLSTCVCYEASGVGHAFSVSENKVLGMVKATRYPLWVGPPCATRLRMSVFRPRVSTMVIWNLPTSRTHHKSRGYSASLSQQAFQSLFFGAVTGNATLNVRWTNTSAMNGVAVLRNSHSSHSNPTR